jgi:hypothetical protein
LLAAAFYPVLAAPAVAGFFIEAVAAGRMTRRWVVRGNCLTENRDVGPLARTRTQSGEPLSATTYRGLLSM